MNFGGSEFLRALSIHGGPELLANFRRMADDIKVAASQAVGEAVLRSLAINMQNAVRTVSTKTDRPRRKMLSHPLDRWWTYKYPAGTAREKVAAALQTIPLGSKQDREFVGRRLAIVGKSGSFYGRLIERGFTVKKFYGLPVKTPTDVPGKWPLSRAFRKMKPQAQMEAIRQFVALMDDLGKTKKRTPRID